MRARIADAVHEARELADGVRVVWSGFILASRPACLHVKVWIDDAGTPRRARIPIGRRC